jgi:hypothetical protein
MGRQWTIVLAGPVVWLASLELEYLLVPWACRRGGRLALAVIALVAAAGVLATARLAWSSWRLAGGGDATADAPPGGRDRFMALSGIGMSLFSALVILASAIPILALGPCE